jgi:hypothetical protein
LHQIKSIKKVKEEELRNIKEEDLKQSSIKKDLQKNTVPSKIKEEEKEEISLSDVDKVKPINFTNSSKN